MKQRVLSQLKVILAVCLVGFGFNEPVFACECRSRGDFEQEFNSSKAVFVGEIVEINKSQPDAIITFKVEKIWKGRKSETIVVRTNNQGKACGYIFSQGEKYLVYAYDKILQTSICTRTKKLKSATDDLKQLAEKKEL